MIFHWIFKSDAATLFLTLNLEVHILFSKLCKFPLHIKNPFSPVILILKFVSMGKKLNNPPGSSKLCLVYLLYQNLVWAYSNFLSMLNLLCILKINLVYSKVRFLYINWLIWVYLTINNLSTGGPQIAPFLCTQGTVLLRKPY